MGGLGTSTLPSLIVIPAAFTVLDDLGQWFERKFHRGGQANRSEIVKPE